MHPGKVLQPKRQRLLDYQVLPVTLDDVHGVARMHAARREETHHVRLFARQQFVIVAVPGQAVPLAVRLGAVRDQVADPHQPGAGELPDCFEVVPGDSSAAHDCEANGRSQTRLRMASSSAGTSCCSGSFRRKRIVSCTASVSIRARQSSDIDPM